MDFKIRFKIPDISMGYNLSCSIGIPLGHELSGHSFRLREWTPAGMSNRFLMIILKIDNSVILNLVEHTFS